ncbi:unnamed protein product [Sphagnum jensenii]|uniref:Uncharacterized protein n=1 Tax=Sphagnum jensenii TaxID=128206 RepID=A0ABP0V733_9BRYO
MPALVIIKNQVKVILLAETRLPAGTKKVKEFAESLGLDVVEISVRRRLDLQAVSDLAQCLKTFNAKVVHAHDVKASFYALRASQKSGEKKPKLVI